MLDYENFGKRLFDIVCSLAGLIVLSPFFILISVLIKIDSPGGPIFFLQERVGRSGEEFKLIKFRSMYTDRSQEKKGFTPGDESRITRLGRYLRKTKIDELPELINVLNGDMSLVGPRPEVPHYVRKWPEEDKNIILSISPGITDYASFWYSNEEEVLYRAEDPELTYVKEVMPYKLDLYKRYVNERTMWLDIRIIFATLGKIVGLNSASLLPELRA